VPADTPMITRDTVAHAKPDPDLFLAAAALLDVEPRQADVVGDSVWDLLAARTTAKRPAQPVLSGLSPEPETPSGQLPQPSLRVSRNRGKFRSRAPPAARRLAPSALE
jgi:hypothetical protein